MRQQRLARTASYDGSRRWRLAHRRVEILVRRRLPAPRRAIRRLLLEGAIELVRLHRSREVGGCVPLCAAEREERTDLSKGGRWDDLSTCRWWPKRHQQHQCSTACTGSRPRCCRATQGRSALAPTRAAGLLRSNARAPPPAKQRPLIASGVCTGPFLVLRPTVHPLARACSDSRLASPCAGRSHPRRSRLRRRRPQSSPTP